ncbi:MAG: flagellar basal body P-ring protein FlgI [Woeseiaceae bacterium]
MLSGKDLSMTLIAGLFLLLSMSSGSASAERVKDLTQVEGVRSNQLIGYGLVVGLNGTGDGSGEVTTQTLRSMISRLGVNIPAGVTLQAKNVAAVAIHAELPPFTKEGMKIDITLSSVASAKSLRGGSLLMTPLRGADNQIYAMAQGNVVVSGFGAGGLDGSKITVNVPSVGRILNGAIVEREVDTPFGLDKEVTLNLFKPDFTTANRLVNVINNSIGPGTSYAKDAGSVVVSSPEDTSQRVAFISMLENMTLTPAEPAAKIIVNARTGTIIIGKNVHISAAAVSHGNLTVTITEGIDVNQPFTDAGTTVVTPTSNLKINQDARTFKIQDSPTLDDVVRGMNELGLAPGDLIAILEALKEAGALHAEIVVI